MSAYLTDQVGSSNPRVSFSFDHRLGGETLERYFASIFAVVLLVTLSLLSGRASACGASASGVAGVSSCSLSEHEEAARKKWRVGVAASYTATALRFGSGLTLDERRVAYEATIDYRVSPRWTFEAGAGNLLGGRVGRGAQAQDFSPGFLASLAASARLVDPLGPRPFVLATSQLSFVGADTHPGAGATGATASYHTFDLRLGAVVGWSLFGTLDPYVVGRAFGGPVYWRFDGSSRVGTDTHHYQVGAGAAFLIGRAVDLFVEGVPIGERAVSAGAGVAFR